MGQQAEPAHTIFNKENHIKCSKKHKSRLNVAHGSTMLGRAKMAPFFYVILFSEPSPKYRAKTDTSYSIDPFNHKVSHSCMLL